MVHLRKFSPSDLYRIYEIEAESFSDPYHPIFLVNLYELYSETFLVAEEGRTVLAYIIARRVWNRGHIVAIAVGKKYRRRGIGRMLIQEVEKRLASTGVKEIWLEVRASNREAIKFYNSLGYRQSSLQKNYYADGESAIIFKKLFR